MKKITAKDVLAILDDPILLEDLKRRKSELLSTGDGMEMLHLDHDFKNNYAANHYLSTLTRILNLLELIGVKV